MAASILVIDDDDRIRASTVRALSDRGFRVFEAVDGMDGLEALDEVEPALVLVDFVMPRMNGYHFLKAIETRSVRPDLPIVLMSTLTDKVGERLLETTRAVECLKKPFSAAELLAVVGRHLADRTLAVTATSRVHPGLAVEDDWLLRAALRERLHNEVADALASRVQALVASRGAADVLALVSEILDEVHDDASVEALLRLVREHDQQRRGP